MPSTAALFDTARRAALHLEALSGVHVEHVGRGPAGHSRFRLHL
jgi:hypothetical protein